MRKMEATKKINGLYDEVRAIEKQLKDAPPAQRTKIRLWIKKTRSRLEDLETRLDK